MKIVGIDPDLKKNGVAIMEGGKYTALASMPFPELLNLIAESERDEKVLFVIEDVNAHKPVFSRGKINAKTRETIAQRVGMVKGVGSVIVELLDFCECHYMLTKPLKGTLKQCKTKPELFKKLTGWQGRSNADTRDAAALIYKYKDRQYKSVFETDYKG